MQIIVEQRTTPKPKPDQTKLGFGRFFTDHMFVMDYNQEEGWYSPRIIPYAPLEVDPATAVFHYGQAVFEGMKAFRSADDRILMFRPKMNLERLNKSNQRLVIPPIDPEFCLQAIRKLIQLDKDWIPTLPGTALYIRPFVIATDPFLGVRASSTYRFIVILSPVGSYYAQGLNPVSIYVEPEYVRAVRGGTGFAKASGNYAGSLKAQQKAQKEGHAQVLWLDGIERRYVEEVGAMNVFFRIGDEVITPELGDSILPGVTRDSVISLLKSWNVELSERKLAIQEIFDAHRNGQLIEAFGTGTAAVISPIGKLAWLGQTIEICDGKIGDLSQKLYDTVTGIQTGRITDQWGWTVEV